MLLPGKRMSGDEHCKRSHILGTIPGSRHAPHWVYAAARPTSRVIPLQSIAGRPGLFVRSPAQAHGLPAPR